MVTSPAVGRSRPVSIVMVVLLPAPLGPRNPKKRPRGTSKETSSTATFFRKALVGWRATVGGPGGVLLRESYPETSSGSIGAGLRRSEVGLGQQREEHAAVRRGPAAPGLPGLRDERAHAQARLLARAYPERVELRDQAAAPLLRDAGGGIAAVETLGVPVHCAGAGGMEVLGHPPPRPAPAYRPPGAAAAEPRPPRRPRAADASPC